MIKARAADWIVLGIDLCLPSEEHILGCQGLAIRPLKIWLKLPSNSQVIGRYTTICGGGNISRQVRNKIILIVPSAKVGTYHLVKPGRISHIAIFTNYIIW